jgi:glycosyltransferase involved in cell wall biosynthesis
MGGGVCSGLAGGGATVTKARPVTEPGGVAAQASTAAGKLVVVSHTPHYWRGHEVVGWGPTVCELSQLTELFARVIHIAPLYRGPAPPACLPYTNPRVRLCPVRPAGGRSVADKLAILWRTPSYLHCIRRELSGADALHIRAPANIALSTLLALPALRAPRLRWIKYAGAWAGYAGEPLSYRLQRWWCRSGPHGAQVTVNGRWPNQPAHVHSFANPCLTQAELSEAQLAVLGKTLGSSACLLFVGALVPAKGADRALRVLAELRRGHTDARLVVAGDGPEQTKLAALARQLGIADRVQWRGWRPRPELAQDYATAHFLLLPSTAEGWPKVLSEGMAWGAVPIASAVGSVPQQLAELGIGAAIAPDDVRGFAAAIAAYLAAPARWAQHSQAAVAAAAAFSYDAYLQRVRGLFKMA